jgi:hypothetical protein
MSDPFAAHASGLDSPARRHFAITPADADLSVVPRALYCTAAGNVVVRDAGGVDVTYPMLAGDVLPFHAVQVRAATTATVVGWY